MAERLELGQTREAQPNMGLADEILFQPGTVYGGLSKGDELNPYYTGADDLISQGSSQYGITPWEQLWGQSGELLDPNALLRSLNAASVFGQSPTTVGDARSQYGGSQQGAFQYQPFQPGYTDTKTAGGDVLSQVLAQMAQGGLGSGYYGAQNQALQGGADPNLVNWLGGINDFNASINDPRERFFDPNALTLGSGSFGGIDLGATDLNALNAWSQQNYGTDLQTLAELGTGLAGARNEFMQDPSAFWNPQSGSFSQLTLPGLTEQESADRMSAYEYAYGNLQGEIQGQRDRDYLSQWNQALGMDPELMRTAAGQYLAGSGNMAQGLLGQAGQMIQAPTDYSALFQYGIAPDLANQALSQLGLQGNLYG